MKTPATSRHTFQASGSLTPLRLRFSGRGRASGNIHVRVTMSQIIESSGWVYHFF